MPSICVTCTKRVQANSIERNKSDKSENSTNLKSEPILLLPLINIKKIAGVTTHSRVLLLRRKAAENLLFIE